MRSDVEENLGRPAPAAVVALALIASRSAQAVLIYRLSHHAHGRGLRPLGHLLSRVNQLLFGVDIHPAAVAGPGLVLRHPVGIVVGRDVVLGSRVRLFQNCTVGNRLSGGPGRPDGMPILEDDVHVFAGAAVLGPVVVGAASRIGANAVLARSCPARSLVAAPEARIVSPVDEPGITQAGTRPRGGLGRERS